MFHNLVSPNIRPLFIPDLPVLYQQQLCHQQRLAPPLQHRRLLSTSLLTRMSLINMRARHMALYLGNQPHQVSPQLRIHCQAQIFNLRQLCLHLKRKRTRCPRVQLEIWWLLNPLSPRHKLLKRQLAVERRWVLKMTKLLNLGKSMPKLQESWSCRKLWGWKQFFRQKKKKMTNRKYPV